MKLRGPFFAGVAFTLVILAMGATALAASGQISFNTVNVAWNGETGIPTGSTITAPNGQQVPSSILYTDEAGGTTNYLSIRAISDLLNVEISYDADTQTAVIQSAKPPYNPDEVDYVLSVEPEVYINDNGEVVVHKKTCPEAVNLASIHGDRIVNAKWSKNTVASFLARIKIFGTDRMGILNELTKVTTLVLNINIRKVYIATHDSIFEGYIDCYVRSTEDLDTLMDHIKKIKGVENVSRIDIKEDK